jgi:hypothetical protein
MGWNNKNQHDNAKIAFLESQIKASIPASDPARNLFMLAVSEVCSWLEGFEKETISDMCAGLCVSSEFY